MNKVTKKTKRSDLKTKRKILRCLERNYTPNWQTYSKTQYKYYFIVYIQHVLLYRKTNLKNKIFFLFHLQQVNYKMHMNIRRMNDRKHHKRSKRGSSKVTR